MLSNAFLYDENFTDADVNNDDLVDKENQTINDSQCNELTKLQSVETDTFEKCVFKKIVEIEPKNHHKTSSSYEKWSANLSKSTKLTFKLSKEGWWNCDVCSTEKFYFPFELIEHYDTGSKI